MNSPRLRTAYSPLFAWEDCTFVNQFVTRSGVGHPDNFFLEGACAGGEMLRIQLPDCKIQKSGKGNPCCQGEEKPARNPIESVKDHDSCNDNQKL